MDEKNRLMKKEEITVKIGSLIPGDIPNVEKSFTYSSRVFLPYDGVGEPSQAILGLVEAGSSISMLEGPSIASLSEGLDFQVGLINTKIYQLNKLSENSPLNGLRLANFNEAQVGDQKYGVGIFGHYGSPDTGGLFKDGRYSAAILLPDESANGIPALVLSNCELPDPVTPIRNITSLFEKLNDKIKG